MGVSASQPACVPDQEAQIWIHRNLIQWFPTTCPECGKCRVVYYAKQEDTGRRRCSSADDSWRRCLCARCGGVSLVPTLLRSVPLRHQRACQGVRRRRKPVPPRLGIVLPVRFGVFLIPPRFYIMPAMSPTAQRPWARPRSAPLRVQERRGAACPVCEAACERNRCWRSASGLLFSSFRLPASRMRVMVAT